MDTTGIREEYFSYDPSYQAYSCLLHVSIMIGTEIDAKSKEVLLLLLVLLIKYRRYQTSAVAKTSLERLE